MRRLWFRNKTYGWGWTPASREGWVITIAFIIVYIVGAVLFTHIINKQPESASIYSWIFFTWILLITSALLALCIKTGEKPEWRWGKKKNQK